LGHKSGEDAASRDRNRQGLHVGQDIQHQNGVRHRQSCSHKRWRSNKVRCLPV
jgi:hypothetical protein